MFCRAASGRTCCSKLLKLASKAFSGNVRFYIISKRGKEIAQWSAYPDEEEVLFPPDTRFKVLEYVRDENEIEIFLEEL